MPPTPTSPARHPASVLLLLAVPLMLIAATGAARGAPPRVLAWDEAVAARKLALVSGESSVEIAGMHPLKRTGALRVKGDAPLAIRALDKPPGPEGKPIQRACLIPAGIGFPLIILMPDEKDPTGVRPQCVDDDPNGFRWGSYRFINATSKELLIRMENKIVRVPQGWKHVDVDLGGENRGIGAMVALAEATDKPIYSAVWEYNKDARTLCFLVPGADPRLSPVAFKAIPEDRLSVQLEEETERPASSDDAKR